MQFCAKPIDIDPLTLDESAFTRLMDRLGADEASRESALSDLKAFAFDPVDKQQAACRFLGDDCATVRLRAVEALRAAGGMNADALARLIPMLDDSHVNVVREVIGALGDGGPLAAPAAGVLLEIYARGEEETWLEASTALMRIGPAAVPVLRALADNPSQSAVLRAAANEFIDELDFSDTRVSHSEALALCFDPAYAAFPTARQRAPRVLQALGVLGMISRGLGRAVLWVMETVFRRMAVTEAPAPQRVMVEAMETSAPAKNASAGTIALATETPTRKAA